MFEKFFIMRSLDPLLLKFGSIFNGIEVRHKDENNDISISLKFLLLASDKKFLIEWKQPQ